MHPGSGVASFLLSAKLELNLKPFKIFEVDFFDLKSQIRLRRTKSQHSNLKPVLGYGDSD